MIEGTGSQVPAAGAAVAVGRMKSSDPIVAVATADHNGLHGIDILEALLHMTEPTGKCRQTAELAMETFGSVGAVLAAEVPELTSQLGIQERIAYSLKAIHLGIHWVVREPIGERVRIGSFADVLDYLRLGHRDETAYLLRALYLDRKNGLISDEEIIRDPVLYVPRCARGIVRCALEHSACAVIVVRHQVQEDPKPSDAEVNFSQQLQHALDLVSIAMHDWIIVGHSRCASLRSLGHL